MVVQKLCMDMALLPVMRCDLFGIGAGLQAASNVAASSINSGVNYKIAKDTNEANVAMNRETNEANVAINDATNETNRAIADEANALNLQMFHEENEWNENMWEKQNAYNDPTAQMQRLIAAGINPNMLGSSGSNPTGNSSDIPASAQFGGAEVATMNPVMLHAGHKDPYEVAFDAPQFLDAYAKAAGIENLQAQTDGLNIENKFKPDLLGSQLDMQTESARQVKEVVDDFVRANAHRMSMRKLEVISKRLANNNLALNNRLMKQTIKERKAQFAEWNSLSSTRKYQAIANLSKTWRSIDAMDEEALHMKAQEQHWRNQDTIANENIDVLKTGLKFRAADMAFASVGFRPDTRRQLAKGLLSMGLPDIGEFVKQLNGAADGNFNNAFNALMHTEAGAKLDRLLDYAISKYIPEVNDIPKPSGGTYSSGNSVRE